jgi:hypothetical protein
MNSAKQESLNSGLQRISMIFLVIPQCLIGRLRKQTVGFVKLNSEGVLQMGSHVPSYSGLSLRLDRQPSRDAHKHCCPG